MGGGPENKFDFQFKSITITDRQRTISDMAVSDISYNNITYGDSSIRLQNHLVPYRSGTIPTLSSNFRGAHILNIELSDQDINNPEAASTKIKNFIDQNKHNFNTPSTCIISVSKNSSIQPSTAISILKDIKSQVSDHLQSQGEPRFGVISVLPAYNVDHINQRAVEGMMKQVKSPSAAVKRKDPIANSFASSVEADNLNKKIPINRLDSFEIKLAKEFVNNYKIGLTSNSARTDQIKALKSALAKGSEIEQKEALKKAIDTIKATITQESRKLGKSDLQKFIESYDKNTSPTQTPPAARKKR